ncbi:hypothetical protein KKF55_06475 [Patescibacteria group bacterium]|nr:hypothetical protein [Patescibacteria group bacterium]
MFSVPEELASLRDKVSPEAQLEVDQWLVTLGVYESIDILKDTSTSHLANILASAPDEDVVSRLMECDKIIQDL